MSGFRFNEKNLFMLQLVLPAFMIITVFEIIPIIIGIDISLRDFFIYKQSRPFIGLRNYTSLLSKPHFYSVVLPNTFLFTFCCLGIQLSMGVGVALLLNRRFKGITLARTIVLLPLMLSPVISGLSFAWIFNDQFGIVNVIISKLGFSPIVWLAGRWTALFAVIIATVWTYIPEVVLLVLAVLQVQPQAPKEAATLDGATALQMFRYITLPHIAPVLAVVLLIQTFDIFREFDHVWAITRGGPARATELISIYAYKETFVYLRFGMGAASSLLGAIIMVVFGLFVYQTFYRLVR